MRSIERTRMDRPSLPIKVGQILRSVQFKLFQRKLSGPDYACNDGSSNMTLFSRESATLDWLSG